MAMTFIGPLESDPTRGIWRDGATGQERVFAVPKTHRPKCAGSFPWNGGTRACFRKAAAGHTLCNVCLRKLEKAEQEARKENPAASAW